MTPNNTPTNTSEEAKRQTRRLVRVISDATRLLPHGIAATSTREAHIILRSKSASKATADAREALEKTFGKVEGLGSYKTSMVHSFFSAGGKIWTSRRSNDDGFSYFGLFISNQHSLDSIKKDASKVNRTSAVAILKAAGVTQDEIERLLRK